MTIEDVIARLEAGMSVDAAAAEAAGDDEHVHESGGRPGCDSPRCAHDIHQNPQRTLRAVDAYRKVIALRNHALEQLDSETDPDSAAVGLACLAAYNAAINALVGIYTEGEQA